MYSVQIYEIAHKNMSNALAPLLAETAIRITSALKQTAVVANRGAEDEP